MQTSFLQAEKYRVSAVQRAQTTFGKPAKGATGRLGGKWITELKLFLTAFLEDSEDVTRLAQGKTRQRFEELQHSARASFLGSWCVGIAQFSRTSRAVGHAKVRILLWITAIIIERRTPQHRPVIHHAELNVIDRLRVAEAASSVRHTKIARIDELDELVSFMVQKHAGIIWIGGTFPKNIVTRRDVRFVLGQTGSGIASMAIGAAENNMRRLVHLFDAAVAFEAATAFRVRFGEGLVDAIARRAILCITGGLSRN